MSSGPSKVIVLDPDPRAGRQVQLGFEREGVPTLVPAIPTDATALELDGADPGIVLVGGKDGQALDLLRRAKELLDAKHADVPIVFTGRGPSRRELEAAGADEVVAGPTYLRDLVTLGRMLRGVRRAERDHLVGSLVETSNVLALVRAFSALGRSAVLTLIRGLRRGEVRFFHGEVTSAQVGLIHGQAALHQLLLWTDARFDYAHEDIVRRHQIPLSPEELFADAEQFLEGVREHAGNLSPSTVLEQDVMRIQSAGKQIPTEVHGVLRMFDGHRVLADILEDSPYRVFETLRVAQKAVEAGLLKIVESQRPKATWRAVLAIEEWLVGSETRESVVERTAKLDSGPVTPSKRKGKKRRAKKQAPLPPPPDTKDIDWGALVPRVIGAEAGPLSGVVPAQQTAGEVELPTRDKPREGLEALMDTDKRQKIFPTEIGLEPSVVVTGGDTDEWERVALDAKQKAEAAEKATADRAVADQRASADAFVLGETAAKIREGDQSRKQRMAVADTPPAGMQAATIAEAVRVLDAEKAAADKAAADNAATHTTAADTATAENAAAETAAAEKAAAEKAAADTAAAETAAADTAAAETSAADKAAAEKAAAEKAAADKAAAEKAATETSAADKAAAEKAAAEKAAADKAAAEKAVAEKAAADKAAAEKAALEKAAAEKAAAETAAAETAAAQKAKAENEAAEKDAAEKAAAAAKPSFNAGHVRSRIASLSPMPPGADEIDDGTAALAAVPQYLGEMKSDPVSALTAVPATITEPRAHRSGSTDAKDLVRALVADVVPPSESRPNVAPAGAGNGAATAAAGNGAPQAASDTSGPAPRAADSSASGPAPRPSDSSERITTRIRPIEDAVTTPFLKPSSDDLSSEPFAKPTAADVGAQPFVKPTAEEIARIGEPITLQEAPRTSIAVADVVTVKDSGDAAVVTAKPSVLISEQPSTTPVASLEPARAVVKPTTDPVAKQDGTPESTDDEPSDGVVRSMIATADTARLARAARMRTPTPEHDGPAIKETTGEIRERPQTETKEPAVLEPSILVADLAAAHDAVAAAATKAAEAPKPPDAASPSRELEVSDVRRDAVAFSEAEEAFFSHADKSTPVHRVPHTETFDDLDEGYEPPKFWDRVFGRKPKKP